MVPLRPMWTIMVAAKLDHSRVLVTMFHQNRSTLKGRSADQRQTDRQTWLKIRALHVCNRTKTAAAFEMLDHIVCSHLACSRTLLVCAV